MRAGADFFLPDRAVAFNQKVERAFPPVGRLVETPMGAMHYLELGDPAAPPLVALHGASGNLLDFSSSIMSGLARRWRVVAVDRPGYGHSEARLARPWGVPEQVASIDAGLSALGLSRYALLGHSYGVALSMAWSVLKPEKVAGVLAVAGGMIDWPGAQGWRYRLGRRPFLGAAMGRIAPLIASPGLLHRELAEVFAPQPAPAIPGSTGTCPPSRQGRRFHPAGCAAPLGDSDDSRRRSPPTARRCRHPATVRPWR